MKNFTITKTVEHYTQTASGKGFKSKPDSVTTETVTAEHYKNYIDAIQFFNSFDFCASCRGYKSYTQAGYLITKVTTISPMREQKQVARFDFVYNE